MKAPSPTTVVAFIAELMFRSRVDAAARVAGAKVVYPGAADDPASAVRAAAPTLVLVDLSLKGREAEDIIAAARAESKARIIAFGSHVDAVRLASAIEAGADEALPRSTFTRHVVDLLRGGDVP